MKYTCSKLFVSIATLCAAFPSIYAAQSDWDTTKTYLEGQRVPGTGGAYNWNTSTSVALDGCAVWWRYNNESQTWEKSSDSFTSESDYIVLTADTINEIDLEIKRGLLYYNTNNVIGGLTVINDQVTQINSPWSKNCMLTIKNDFTKIGTGNFSFRTRGYVGDSGYMDSGLNIEGNAILGDGTETTNGNVYFGSNGDTTAGSYMGPLSTVYIGKDLIFNGSKYTARFNVGLDSYSATYDVNSPDIVIKGIVSSEAQGVIHINERNGDYSGTTTVMSVGGVAGHSIFRNNSSGTADNTLSVLVFNNAAGTTYTSTAMIYDDANSFNVEGSTESGQSLGFNDHSKVAIVMNGEGTQILSNPGRMKFSGGVTVNRGTLLVNALSASGAYITEADGSRTYQCTHGNLTMNGGTFGFMSGTKGGEWSFDEMFWKSGNIQLNVYEDSYDTLIFTGMFGFSDGETDLINLTFQGNSIVVLLEEKKIISWESVDQNITSDSFVANNVFDPIMGGEYEAQFRVANDGLYVQYVAVPEPALIGLFFGAFALIAAKRKRR